ncbi:DUF3307 domain-containing protein [Limibacter armeniacum]|uniref:DUF3307 domain-containing protein n=1 Tax=Limibacter armeniacum TaxID=466084 RepID=UPI002FE57C6C
MIATLVMLNICHWAADFTHLSTPWMLKAKQTGKPLFPIFIHATIHAALFFNVIFILHNIEKALLAAIIELSTHFLIDVLKGRMNVWCPTVKSPENTYHWWIFGTDQLLHQLVIIGIAYMVCT